MALLVQVVLAFMLILCAAQRLRCIPSMLSVPSDEPSVCNCSLHSETMSTALFKCVVLLAIDSLSLHNNKAMSPASITVAVFSEVT